MTYLFSRVMRNRSLELLHGAGNLVAHGGLALLVVDLSPAKETASSASAGGGGGGCDAGGAGVVVVTVGHFGGLI